MGEIKFGEIKEVTRVCFSCGSKIGWLKPVIKTPGGALIATCFTEQNGSIDEESDMFFELAKRFAIAHVCEECFKAYFGIDE